MHGLKYIFRNINLLNIMLIAVIIILANHIFLPMFNKSVTYKLPAGKKIISDKDEKPAESHVTSPSDYTIIAEENLFHPDRKIPAEKKAEQPLPKPEFVLYGTLITDDMRLAYLEDLKEPHSSPGRGRRQTVLKIGDTISGFTVKEIDTEKVVVVRGEERIVVPINDPSQPKARTATTMPSSGQVAPGKPPVGSTQPLGIQRPRGGTSTLLPKAPVPSTSTPQSQKPTHPASKNPAKKE
jgi:hypothetical protein